MVALDSLLIAGVWIVGAPLLSHTWSAESGGTVYSVLQVAFGAGTVTGCYPIGIHLSEPAGIARIMVLGYPALRGCLTG